MAEVEHRNNCGLKTLGKVFSVLTLLMFALVCGCAPQPTAEQQAAALAAVFNKSNCFLQGKAYLWYIQHNRRQ